MNKYTNTYYCQYDTLRLSAKVTQDKNSKLLSIDYQIRSTQKDLLESGLVDYSNEDLHVKWHRKESEKILKNYYNKTRNTVIVPKYIQNSLLTIIQGDSIIYREMMFSDSPINLASIHTKDMTWYIKDIEYQLDKNITNELTATIRIESKLFSNEYKVKYHVLLSDSKVYLHLSSNSDLTLLDKTLKKRNRTTLINKCLKYYFPEYNCKLSKWETTKVVNNRKKNIKVYHVSVDTEDKGSFISKGYFEDFKLDKDILNNSFQYMETIYDLVQVSNDITLKALETIYSGPNGMSRDSNSNN